MVAWPITNDQSPADTRVDAPRTPHAPRPPAILLAVHGSSSGAHSSPNGPAECRHFPAKSSTAVHWHGAATPRGPTPVCSLAESLCLWSPLSFCRRYPYPSCVLSEDARRAHTDQPWRVPRRQADPARQVSNPYWPVNQRIPSLSRAPAVGIYLPHASHGLAPTNAFLSLSLSLPLSQFESTHSARSRSTDAEATPTGRGTPAVPASFPSSDGRACTEAATTRRAEALPHLHRARARRRCGGDARARRRCREADTPPRRKSPGQEPARREPLPRGVTHLPRDRRPRLRLPLGVQRRRYNTRRRRRRRMEEQEQEHEHENVCVDPYPDPDPEFGYTTPRLQAGSYPLDNSPVSSPTVEPDAEQPASPTSATEPRISSVPTSASSRHGDCLFLLLPLFVIGWMRVPSPRAGNLVMGWDMGYGSVRFLIRDFALSHRAGSCACCAIAVACCSTVPQIRFLSLCLWVQWSWSTAMAEMYHCCLHSSDETGMNTNGYRSIPTIIWILNTGSRFLYGICYRIRIV